MLVILANDCGSSLTRNIVQVGADRAELLLMPPPLLEVQRESIDSYKASRQSSPEPQDEAWVEFGGQSYMVGFLAQKELGARFNPKDIKYENAIRKILAAVGAIAVSKGLPYRFELALGSLLPRKEYEHREFFHRGLSQALADFSFCDKSFSVSLEKFLCRPEGGGLVWSRSRHLGDAFRRMTIVTLMFGYRDVSIEVVERGVSSGESVPLGLLWLLKRVQSRTSALEEQPLLEAIHQAGDKIKPKQFKPLARSRDPDFQAEEAAQIAEAVRLSRQEYWSRIAEWLRSVLPPRIDEVVIGGGTASYLRPELQAYFRGIPISWAAELEEDVRRVFNISAAENHFCLRLADVYGLYRCLRQQVSPSRLELVAQD